MSSKVSVCIPVYNGEKFIKDTVDMILAQDYDNIEVLLCDDVSQDNSYAEMEKIKDPRVRIFKNEINLGLGGNWNRLLQEVTGDYVLLFCDDDIIYPGAIKAKVKILDDNPDVNIVFSSSFIVSERGRKLIKRRQFHKDTKINGKDYLPTLFTTKNVFAEPGNNLMRKTAMDRIGKFDSNLWYMIDWDYWCRMLTTGNAYYIDKPYFGFRVHANSATGSNMDGKKKVMDDEKRFYDKHKAGTCFDVTEEMLVTRERNVESRLETRMIFVNVLGFITKKL